MISETLGAILGIAMLIIFIFITLYMFLFMIAAMIRTKDKAGLVISLVATVLFIWFFVTLVLKYLGI